MQDGENSHNLGGLLGKHCRWGELGFPGTQKNKVKGTLTKNVEGRALATHQVPEGTAEMGRSGGWE